MVVRRSAATFWVIFSYIPFPFSNCEVLAFPCPQPYDRAINLLPGFPLPMDIGIADAEYMGDTSPALPTPAPSLPRTFLACNSELDTVKFILTSWQSYFRVSLNAPWRVVYTAALHALSSEQGL